MNTIVDDQKEINNETFMYYFGYQNPSFLLKDLYTNKNVTKDQNLTKLSGSKIVLKAYSQVWDNFW